MLIAINIDRETYESMFDLGLEIEKIQRSQCLDEAFLSFNNALKYYGYDNACYLLMTDNTLINQKALDGLATSYPQDWINYYNKNNYQKFDAVWSRLLNKQVPFFWEDAIKEAIYNLCDDTDQSLKTLKIMNEAEDAGVVDGIGISFANSAGEITGIGISREKNEGCNNIKNLSEIYFLSTVFHDKYISSFQDHTYLNITEREKDVLSWSTEGKNDYEIAHLLNISHATVRFHWKNIFKKMKVNNKVLATSIGIRSKIIVPGHIAPSKVNT